MTVGEMDDLRVPDALSDAGPDAGELLDGRYRIDELIGEGGMARVYRASDVMLGRTVAVKVFRSGTADAADLARKESETTLLASLSHPSLVTLFDARVDTDEGAYLVMEYIDGSTLADRLVTGPIASADAASLAGDLGEALHVVHAAGSSTATSSRRTSCCGRPCCPGTRSARRSPTSASPTSSTRPA
jgi:serine/threonine protein kinase